MRDREVGILRPSVERYTLSLVSGMDRETFDKMWDMSAEGSETENCFMRLHQTEYYAEGRDDGKVLEGMPDVMHLPG
jgi:hypothetical protein